jgi:hypothetical protein
MAQAETKVPAAAVQQIDLKKIVVGSYNPRNLESKQEQDALAELVRSVEARGVISPVKVRPIKGGSVTARACDGRAVPRPPRLKSQGGVGSGSAHSPRLALRASNSASA